MQDKAVTEILAEILTKDEHKHIGEALREWSLARMAKRKKRQLANYHVIEDASNAFYWSEADNGYSRLMWRGENKPVELDVSGIVVDCFFGPITSRSNIRSRHPQEFSQTIKLAAPGDVNFELALVAIDAIHTVADQMGHEGMLRPLEWSSFEGMKALSASTRFLTQSRFKPTFASEVDLPEEVDPQGRLKTLINDHGLLHTTENHVECEDIDYSGVDGTMRKKPCSVLNIRRGQAVEVTVSFGMVKAGTQKTFLIQVRHVLIVNRAGSLAIEKIRREYLAALQRKQAQLPKPVLKRIAEEDPMFDGPPVKKTQSAEEVEMVQTVE